ncbi:MAG: peptidoglycan editing factor PgeF [Leptolyngbya sp. SIO1D8]|nr:peptidoglycan editing factor PgeF [Leptolyngbya sp. SIO1D8]
MKDLWHWHIETEYPYLTTTLLKYWQHGFFTRAAWPKAPEAISPHLDMSATVYRAKQVHGKRVLNPSGFPLGSPGAEADSSRPEADAVMTMAPQQAAWVCTADCTPVLIADATTGQVAAVHAGWRGTALKIVPETIRCMQNHGSQLSDLRVAMGPAIAGEVYQVTTHVAAEVGRSLTLTEADAADLLNQLQTMESPPILPDSTPGRVRLDVRRILDLQLAEIGLAPEQIAIAPHCTYQEPEKFFSYRRTREKKVQWSGIVST